MEAGDISGSLGNIWSNKPVSNFKMKLLYKFENYTKKKKKKKFREGNETKSDEGVLKTIWNLSRVDWLLKAGPFSLLVVFQFLVYSFEIEPKEKTLAWPGKGGGLEPWCCGSCEVVWHLIAY